jgi:hypothetical protein
MPIWGIILIAIIWAGVGLAMAIIIIEPNEDSPKTIAITSIAFILFAPVILIAAVVIKLLQKLGIR